MVNELDKSLEHQYYSNNTIRLLYIHVHIYTYISIIKACIHKQIV